MPTLFNRSRRAFLAGAAGLGLSLGLGLGVTPFAAQAHGLPYYDDATTLYTMSNASEGNEILSFKQHADGTLEAGPHYATGGTGTGAGLGSQGAIAADDDFLITVNAGSDDISVFRVTPHGLYLTDRVPSGGVQPVSVTLDRHLVYVVNAGSDNIAGFWMTPRGRLVALPGSERGLGATGTAPAQIQFAHNGRVLVITEKATNKIVTFTLNRFDTPAVMHELASAAPTPFGFVIARRHLALVSEAVGGTPNASTLSSYRIAHNGEITVLDPAVATTQTAACWVAVTPDGRFAFTTNTGSSSVSSFLVRRNGDLMLLNPAAGSTGDGSRPIDMALSDDADFLYVLSGDTNSITTFKRFGGSLQIADTVLGLPAGTTGLVAF